MEKQNRVLHYTDFLKYQLKLDKILIPKNVFRFLKYFSMTSSIKMALCIALIGLTSFQTSDDVFRLTIAKASKLNTRNSESDII